MTENFKFLSDQQVIFDKYEKGYATIIATPGSGKTTIISYLIKKLCDNKKINPSTILVLTYTDSAALEFKNRTISLLRNTYRTPEFSTIHSFCNRILRKFSPEHEEVEVISEDRSLTILLNILVKLGFEITEDNWMNITKDIFLLINQCRSKFGFEKLKKLKDLDDFKILEQIKFEGSINSVLLKCIKLLPLIWEEYHNFLTKMGYIDFNDMICETYNLIKNNPTILNYLQENYHYIFEDEAQDSTNLQFEILKLIAGSDGNYVRVGDPNQNIYSSFTLACSESLIEFSKENPVFSMRQSTRSNIRIIKLANDLHKEFSSYFPSLYKLEPAGAFNPDQGKIIIKSFSNINEKYLEVFKILRNLDIENETTAILCPTNNQCKEIYERLVQQGFNVILHKEQNDLLKSDLIKTIKDIFEFILDPKDLKKLFYILEKLGISIDIINEIFKENHISYEYIKSLAQDQIFFSNFSIDTKLISSVFKKVLQLLESVYLPVSNIFEIVISIFYDSEDMKIERTQARKLHKIWRQFTQRSQLSGIDDFLRWLKRYSTNNLIQNMISFYKEDKEDFYKKGYIHVLTQHKSKGLEWDSVFILHLNNWDFKDIYSYYPKEIKDPVPVLKAIIQQEDLNKILSKEREKLIAESFRRLYVCITRAKKFLFIGYSETSNGKPKSPHQAFIFLQQKTKI